jgi:N-acetylmuramoyl-L-alanine amidase
MNRLLPPSLCLILIGTIIALTPMSEARLHASSASYSTAIVGSSQQHSAKRLFKRHSSSPNHCSHRHSHRGKHRLHLPHALAAAKSHFAYAKDFFMWNAPAGINGNMPPTLASLVKESFTRGQASKYAPYQLLQAGIFQDDPLLGGIFRRREDVKYIILHSTETGRAADASRVIKSWNRGLRHPGAQYVVDRDGIIHQTVDPSFGTVHVDIFRTLLGVNNDNSIGIEMVRSGDQKYTPEQLTSVEHLVVYLQSYFNVSDDHIYSHHEVQPSDRTDPVNFDWTAFNAAKAGLHTQAVAFKRRANTSTP